MRINQHIILPLDVNLRRARAAIKRRSIDFMTDLCKQHGGRWRILKQVAGYNNDDCVKNQFTVEITYTNE